MSDDLAAQRLMWMKGHRAMARRLLDDSRITDPQTRAVIAEHHDFTDAWIVDAQAASGPSQPAAGGDGQ